LDWKARRRLIPGDRGILAEVAVTSAQINLVADPHTRACDVMDALRALNGHESPLSPEST
jgi:hypothetical protein